MKAVLVISHGDFAAGIKMSVEMIAGQQDNLHALGLTPSGGPEELEGKIDALMPQLEAFDQIFVFTDLLGGSPGNTAFAKFVADERIEIIAGVNFPMLLTCVLTEDITVDALMETGRDGIVSLRQMFAEMDDDE